MIKIGILTYLYLLIALISGYFYEILFYYIALLVHEAGHLVVIYLLKKRVAKIEFSPIGGAIEVEGLANDFNLNAFLIYVGGPFFSLMLFLCAFLGGWNDTFVLSSFLILMINLIPILPFDGGHLLMILLQNLVWYKRVYKIAHFVSLSILMVTIYLLWGNLLFIAIIGYFVIQNIIGLKDAKLHYHHFLLHKFLYPNPKLHIKLIHKDYYNRLFKGYNNYLYQGDGLIDETTLLNVRFKMMHEMTKD